MGRFPAPTQPLLEDSLPTSVASEQVEFRKQMTKVEIDSINDLY